LSLLDNQHINVIDERCWWVEVTEQIMLIAVCEYIRSVPNPAEENRE